MVDAAERGHVDGLAADGACGADSCGVFAGAAVDDGVDGDLEGVLVCGDVYLCGGRIRSAGGVDALSREREIEKLVPWGLTWEQEREQERERERERETYNLKSMCHDPHSHKFLAVVPPVHHQGICQSLDNGTLCFAEAFRGVAAGGVGDVDGGADLNVISMREKSVVSFMGSQFEVDRVEWVRRGDCFFVLFACWQQHSGD